MKNAYFIALLFISQWVSAQIKFNGDFEDIDPVTKKPVGWVLSFNKTQETAYLAKADSMVKQHGKVSFSLEQISKESNFRAIDFVFSQHFIGKEIELRGYIKSEQVNSGYGGLWLRLDGKNQSTIGIDNMQDRGVKGTTEWKQYSIKLPYKTDAVMAIHAGGLLVGDGKLWLDNMEVLIDGKPIEQVKTKEILLAKAETDTSFSKSSGIKTLVLTPQLTTKLTLAGQFWGFIKYHHPAIAKGDYNWDAELFRLLPTVISSGNNEELSVALERFLDQFPVPQSCKVCKSLANEKYEIKPDYGSLLDGTVLNRSLTDKLVYLRDNRNVAQNFYVELSGEVKNPNFANERPYYQMPYPDLGYRLLSLYRYWAIINYFFPYKNVIGEDWNVVLPSALPEFVNAKNERDYSLAALKLISRIHDTHANLWSGSRALNEFKGKYAAPFQSKFIQGKLVITALHTDTLDVKSKLAVGDIITSINGKDIQALMSEYLPITAASNYDTQLRDLPGSYLFRSNEPKLTIHIERPGNTFDYQVPMGNLNVSYRNPQFEEAAAFKVLDNGFGYLFPGKYKNADLPAIRTLFANTKGLIIDMRTYPSEFMPFTFGNYIKAQTSPFAKFTKGSTAYPGAFAYTESVINGKTERDNYPGKVVVIVNATSQSQAEYTTMAFQSSPNVKVIGSTTAGADGNVSSITLPGGLMTMISGIGVFYPDGKPTQRVGVRIDEKIYPTIEGVRDGKDELLEKAVDLLKKGW